MEEITLPLQAVQKVIGLELTDSTNNVAKELAQDGQEANTLVLACRQTGGRGQFDRTFSSEEGGIYFSLILRPAVHPRRNSSFSLKVAQAVSGALEDLFEMKTKIKAPNDVLAWEPKTKKWKKICGILIETSAKEDKTDWMVVGVGLNVNNRLPASLKDTAVSVKQLVGQEVLKEIVLEAVLEHFWRRYSEWERSVC